MLLKEKVEVNAEDSFGQTPLSVACDSQVQKLLKEAGGKVNADAEESAMSPPISPTRSPERSRDPSPSGRERSPSPPMAKQKGPKLFEVEIGGLHNREKPRH